MSSQISTQKSKWQPKPSAKEPKYTKFNVNAAPFRPVGWKPEHELEVKKDYLIQNLMKQKITLTPEQLEAAEKDPNVLTQEIVKQLSTPQQPQKQLELRFDACMQMIEDMIGLGDELK